MTYFKTRSDDKIIIPDGRKEKIEVFGTKNLKRGPSVTVTS